MSSLAAVLDFQGDLEQGFKVSVMIGPENSKPHTSDKGHLPANERLATLHTAWHDAYDRFYNSSSIRAIKLTSAGRNINRTSLRQRCVDTADQLVEELNHWLTSNTFWSIQQSLLSTLTAQPARIILCADDDRLWQLPWHEWSLFKAFPRASISFSQWEYSQRQDSNRKKTSKQVRILACLAADAAIDTEPDKQYLSETLNATVLERCDRIDMGSHLWDDPWDVMVFSGHSRTEEGKGEVFIYSEDQTADNLTLDQLKRTLQKSVSQGLKLVVFNSCQGVGLARQLQQLNVPHIAVMREPIPDTVAHRFLEYFFDAFKSGDSLDAAIEAARGQLEKLHYEFPCASWLPVIWQSPATQTLTWETLKGIKPATSDPKEDNSLIWQGMRGLVLMFLVSLFVTSITLGIRATGILQPWELQAYDQLMRWRPSESVDEHVVIVGVTAQDVQTLEEDPLSDRTVLQLLKAVEAFKPQSIGLDILRFAPVESEADYNVLANYLAQPEAITTVICEYADKHMRGTSPPPGVSEGNLGFSNVIRDADGFIRRHLISTGGHNASACTTANSLSFATALRYLQKEGIEPAIVSHHNQQYIQLGSEVIKDLSSSPQIGGYQNRVSVGYQTMANYRHGNNAIPIISVSKLFSGQVTRELIQDKTVFIGYVHYGSDDSFPTPYGEMPGVAIHAHLASQLINRVLNKRPLITPVPRRLEELWIWFWTFSLGMIYTFAHSRKIKRFLILGSILLFFLLCYWILVTGFWIALIPCLLGLGLNSLALKGLELIVRHSKISKGLISNMESK